jgi:hypothetical protein
MSMPASHDYTITSIITSAFTKTDTTIRRPRWQIMTAK